MKVLGMEEKEFGLMCRALTTRVAALKAPLDLIPILGGVGDAGGVGIM